MLSEQFKHVVSGATAAALPVMATAALAIPRMTQDASEVPIVGSERVTHVEPNVPHWNRNLSQQFPAYHNSANTPKGVIPTSHVVVTQEGNVEKMSAAEVSHRLQYFGGTKRTGDDVWVVGSKW